MGLLDVVKGVGGGALDVVQGGAGFAVDTVKAAAELATGDIGGAADTWFESWQEDILGNVVGGAFGPEGIIGSVIKALPEEGPFGFIRSGGRQVITPVMEGWDWVMQTAVDDGLGTFATVMHAGLRGGNPLKIFDSSTWSEAWDINSKSFDPVTGERIEGHGRTFGQSVAAALWINDPFDNEQYDAIKNDSLFNLVSGTLDFAQEFLDPVDIMLGGSANLLSGKTAIAFKTQDSYKIIGKGKYLGKRYLAPQRIYTPNMRGTGAGWRRIDQKVGSNFITKKFWKELTPEQKRIRIAIGTKATEARAAAFVDSNRWASVETQLKQIDAQTTKSATLETINKEGELEYTKNPEHLSREEAAAQRAGVLRQLVGRKGAKMPEEAIFAIAHGATPEARRLTARAAMGDGTAFREASAIASNVRSLLADEGVSNQTGSLSFAQQLDEIDTLNVDRKVLSEKIKDYDELEKAGKLTPQQKGWRKRYDNQRKEMDRRVGELNVSTAKIRQDYGLDDVDFEIMFDLQSELFENQVKRVQNTSVGPVVDDISELISGDAGMQAMTEFALHRLADAEINPIAAREFGRIDEVWRRRSLDEVVGRRIRSMTERFVDTAEDVYWIPSVINPLGFRKLRVLTERVPQALIDFNDTQAFTQYERILAQASRIKIKGNRVASASKKNVEQRLGQWMEILERGDVGFQNELRTLYDNTINDLIDDIEKMLEEAKPPIIINGKSLRDELNNANSLKNSSVINRYGEQTTDHMSTKGREQVGVTQDSRQHTTVSYGDTTVNYAMSPQQVLQSAVLPRFDLINSQLQDLARKDGTLKSKVWVTTKDVTKRVTRYPRRTTEIVNGIWRPAVLLTPKWPMRVQLDETLRRMADLGTISEMRSLFGAMGDLKDGYASRAIENGLTNIPTRLRQTVRENELAALGDNVTKEVRQAKLDEIKELTDGQILEKLDDKKVKEIVLESAKEARIEAGYNRWKPLLARAGIGAFLVNPIAGAAWAGMYGVSQFRRTNRVAIRRSGIAHADLQMKEAQRLLKEAIEDGDTVLIAHANFLLDQGANMNSVINELHKYDVDLSQVKNAVEKADGLLKEAGFDGVRFGNVAARGAFGDDAAYIEMLQKSVSSSKAQHAMYRGYRKSSERELRKYTNVEWRSWDVAADNPNVFEKGFTDMLQRYTAIGTRWQSSFFDIVWGEGSRTSRIENLASELRRNEPLAQSTGVWFDLQKTDDTVGLSKEIATKIIDEYDNVLPPELLPNTRKKARNNQGDVSWKDVKTELSERIEEVDFDTNVSNNIISQIRRGDIEGVPSYEHFGKSVAPHPKSIDTHRFNISKELDATLERIFENLGTLPADHLSRNPYYKTKYNRHVYQYLARYMDENGEVVINATQLRRVEDQARKAALRETRDLLYDLAEETRIGEITATIMPFYNAWQEVIGRWAKLGQDNPAFVAKAARLYMSDWNAEVLGITEVHDEESGASFLAFRLPEGLLGGVKKWNEANLPSALRPGPLGQITSDNPIRFSKEGLASMLQSTTPGFGPLVSIPVREAVLADPSLEETFDFMFPFGHPEGGLLDRVKSNLMPAYMQNIENLVGDTPTRERVVQSMALQIFVENAEAGNPIDIEDKVQLNALIEEANTRANNFFTFRVATGLLMPTSTSTFSPYDDLMKEARKLQKDHGSMKGNQLFLEEYGPELFALTARMTKLNDGVAASATSEEAYMENQELVQNHPEVGGWVTGSLGSGDEEFKFNAAVYRRQTEMEISPSDPRKRRERKTIYDTIADTEIERGWASYSVYRDLVRAEQDKMKEAGLSYSLNSKNMIAVKMTFDMMVDRLKEENPSWAVEFSEKTQISKMPAIIDGFMSGLEYDSILQRPSTQHVIDYLQLRSLVEKELIRRSTTVDPRTGRFGSVSLSANSNADLMMLWETEREDIAIRPEFSKIYDRYFERDFISEDSFVSELRPDLWTKFENGTGF